MMQLPYTLSPDRPTQLGLIVLQSDETLEHDMRRLLPEDVELLVSRVASGTELSTDMIAGMEGRLTKAASLLPRDAVLSAVGYGCTSASAQIGSDRVATLIQKGASTPYVTDPAAALIAACNALQVSRIGLISPYIASISDRLRQVLLHAGISVTSFGSFNEPIEGNVVRITEESLRNAARTIAADESCEAVFLSCTNVRTLDLIDDLEKDLGRPVLSSNQVLAWHMLQLAGHVPAAMAPGRICQQALV